MKKILVVAVPVLAALAIGVSGLAFTPAACACRSAPQVLALEAGLPQANDWKAAATLRADDLESGLRKNLIGTNPDTRSLFPSTPFGCTNPAGPVAECYVETGASWLLSRGVLVRIERAKVGTVTGLSARNIWRYRPNNSFKPKPLRGSA